MMSNTYEIKSLYISVLIAIICFSGFGCNRSSDSSRSKATKVVAVSEADVASLLKGSAFEGYPITSLQHKDTLKLSNIMMLEGMSVFKQGQGKRENSSATDSAEMLLQRTLGTEQSNFLPLDRDLNIDCFVEGTAQYDVDESSLETATITFEQCMPTPTLSLSGVLQVSSVYIPKGENRDSEEVMIELQTESAFALVFDDTVYGFDFYQSFVARLEDQVKVYSQDIQFYAPEHTGPIFCDMFAEVYSMRDGSPEGADEWRLNCSGSEEEFNFELGGYTEDKVFDIYVNTPLQHDIKQESHFLFTSPSNTVEFSSATNHDFWQPTDVIDYILEIKNITPLEENSEVNTMAELNSPLSDVDVHLYVTIRNEEGSIVGHCERGIMPWSISEVLCSIPMSPESEYSIKVENRTVVSIGFPVPSLRYEVALYSPDEYLAKKQSIQPSFQELEPTGLDDQQYDGTGDIDGVSLPGEMPTELGDQQYDGTGDIHNVLLPGEMPGEVFDAPIVESLVTDNISDLSIPKKFMELGSVLTADIKKDETYRGTLVRSIDLEESSNSSTSLYFETGAYGDYYVEFKASNVEVSFDLQSVQHRQFRNHTCSKDAHPYDLKANTCVALLEPNRRYHIQLRFFTPGEARYQVRVGFVPGQDAEPPIIPENHSYTFLPHETDLSKFVLSWNFALDLRTAPGNLKYHVFKSSTNELSTLEQLESYLNTDKHVGTVIGTESIEVEHDILSEERVYLNVMVEDLRRHRAIYPVHVQGATSLVHEDSRRIKVIDVSGQDLKLDWTNSPTAGVTYHIYRFANDPTKTYSLETLIEAEPIASTTGSFYTVRGLSYGETYFLNVRASTENGLQGVYRTIVYTPHEGNSFYASLEFDDLTSVVTTGYRSLDNQVRYGGNLRTNSNANFGNYSSLGGGAGHPVRFNFVHDRFGVPKSALRLNQTQDLLFSSIPFLWYQNGYSLAYWAKLDTNVNRHSILAFDQGHDKNISGILLKLDYNPVESRFELTWRKSNGQEETTYIEQAESLLDGKYHFFTVTIARERLRIYVDGIRVAETQILDSVLLDNIAGGLASFQDSAAFYGEIDDLYAYKEELSQEDVSRIMHNGMSFTPPPLDFGENDPTETETLSRSRLSRTDTQGDVASATHPLSEQFVGMGALPEHIQGDLRPSKAGMAYAQRFGNGGDYYSIPVPSCFIDTSGQCSLLTSAKMLYPKNDAVLFSIVRPGTEETLFSVEAIFDVPASEQVQCYVMETSSYAAGLGASPASQHYYQSDVCDGLELNSLFEPQQLYQESIPPAESKVAQLRIRGKNLDSRFDTQLHDLKWHHITLIYDQGNLNLQIGPHIIELDDPLPDLSASDEIRFGQDGSKDANRIYGSFGDIEVINTILSDSEMKERR